MFSGYLDRPDATADAIDADGWFHTGDLATADADGYLTITGRRSEGDPLGRRVDRAGRGGGRGPHASRRRRGRRGRAPRPAVGRGGVRGDRRARPARRVPTVDELRAHVATVLVGPKQPRVVVAVDELPHTDATGQIRRAALRAEILAGGAHASD